ncbi:MAG: beta-ketoacyl synthase [Candidatus Binatia bacterium]
MTGRTAAITGIGLIAPTGLGFGPFWTAVTTATPAIRRLRRFNSNGLSSHVAGEIDDDLYADRVDPRKARTTTRATRLALVAADLAMMDAKMPADSVPPHAFGVIVGTALGGWADAEQQVALAVERGTRRVNPFIVAGSGHHGPGIEVAAALGAQGPQVTFSSGCPSSLQALAHAASLITSGAVHMCLAGGVEAPIMPVSFAALCRTNELSTEDDDPSRASRPFDTAHCGMVLSEGGCFFVLEELAAARRRGATVYATLLGAAQSCDARGLYAVEESRDAAAAAMRHAFDTAGVGPRDLDYICAHANAAPVFDRKEIGVLTAALGEFLPTIAISSIKGVIGHPFGAAGAFQTAASALAIATDTIPPTANLIEPADDCLAKHVIGAPLRAPVRRVLVTSYGYGGVNAYLVLGAPDA